MPIRIKQNLRYQVYVSVVLRKILNYTFRPFVSWSLSDPEVRQKRGQTPTENDILLTNGLYV